MAKRKIPSEGAYWMMPPEIRVNKRLAMFTPAYGAYLRRVKGARRSNAIQKARGGQGLAGARARWDCSTPWRTPKRYWDEGAKNERTRSALEHAAEQERIAQLHRERPVTVVQDDGNPASFNRMMRGLPVRFPSPQEQAENERAIRDKKEADERSRPLWRSK
jgi:hypothetical protein